MKHLTRDEMKKVMGGDASTGCKCGGATGTVYHCTGSYANCTNPTAGGCNGAHGCLEYCGVSQNSGANCWLSNLA
ncbi:MAG: hypothetical protein JSU03_11095 [Bacteroidetes bacterium]|nr:hypothetical protein [Bacteroidota bacterium]MBS1757816.1 hypothetical protein [Bacteroidota bacterium]